MLRIIWMILGLFGFKNLLSPELIGKVLSAVNVHGLSTILNALAANGFGDMVKSWLSTGPNPKITPDQLIKGVGADKLEDMAKQAGLPVDQFTKSLSIALPNLVDKLSPDGQLQEHGWLEKALEFMNANK